MNQSGVEFGCDSAHLQLAVMTSHIQVISAGVCSQREKPSLELRSLFVCWFVDSFLSFFQRGSCFYSMKTRSEDGVWRPDQWSQWRTPPMDNMDRRPSWTRPRHRWVQFLFTSRLQFLWRSWWWTHGHGRVDASPPAVVLVLVLVLLVSDVVVLLFGQLKFTDAAEHGAVLVAVVMLYLFPFWDKYWIPFFAPLDLVVTFVYLFIFKSLSLYLFPVDVCLCWAVFVLLRKPGKIKKNKRTHRCRISIRFNETKYRDISVYFLQSLTCDRHRRAVRRIDLFSRSEPVNVRFFFGPTVWSNYLAHWYVHHFSVHAARHQRRKCLLWWW